MHKADFVAILRTDPSNFDFDDTNQSTLFEYGAGSSVLNAVNPFAGGTVDEPQTDDGFGRSTNLPV